MRVTLTNADTVRAATMGKSDDDDSTARRLASRRIEEMPTIDEPPTTEVGFALTGAVVGGRFRLGERLSWGGMGTVYRAMDQVTGREVAVKIPHLGDSNTDARFQSESAAVASVVCSSVIAYVAHGSTDEPFLAMELVSGEPLVMHLQKGALDLETTLTIGRRIASALAAIHLGGWVHRDIKPGNIVVARDGTAKLLDFGLSREIEGLGSTTAGQMLGTLGYMAPEQFHPPRTPDTRSDVYSLGIVLYECITGKKAFHRTVADVLSKRVDAALDVRALRLPDQLTSTLERTLAADKATRPEDGLELLMGLVAASDPAFAAPPKQQTRAAIVELLRMGAVHFTGEIRENGLDAQRVAHGIARLFAEIVAPSLVVRLRCDPLGSARMGSHATALEPFFAEARGRSLVVLLEDALYCDPRSAERLAALASERGIYLVAVSPCDGESSPPVFEGVPRIAGPWPDAADTWSLTPMARWCLRAACMFGWRFTHRGVQHLIAGPEANEVERALNELAARGFIAREDPGFVFASSKALAAARRLARPQEIRLGTRLALAAEKPSPLLAEELVSVEAACDRLSSTTSP